MDERITIESGPTAPDRCNCDAERRRTRMRHFDVTPSAGGGLTAWNHALGRLFAGVLDGPVHCIVVIQPPNQRYVQAMIGHSHAHVESSGNAFLTGDFRLDPSEERHLERLGFESPDRDDEGEIENWGQFHSDADPFRIADLMTLTLVEVMAFDARWPIEIEVFGAEHPCARCTWGDDGNDGDG